MDFHDATGYETPGDYVLTVNSSAVSYTQTYMEGTAPPSPPSFSCYDDFSGNDTGWDSGTTWSGDLTVTVNTSVTPLIYSNEFIYVNGGNTAISITENADGNQSEIYSHAIPEQTNTFYMSFLARFNETPTGDYNYLALGRKVSNNDSGVALGRVYKSSTVGCAFMNDGSVKQLFSAAPQKGKTFFVVAKYIWNDSTSTFTGLTAYLNPTSTVQESAEESVTLSGTVNADFDSVDVQYYGNANADFDEIRVGLTWEDVVPANIYPLKVINASLSPEYFTITFNGEPAAFYKIIKASGDY
ncbi:MAG: hypothetical protein PF904_07145 [Kiritimatiellae bacterium]|nr:hypothetical protein [Kiritimatiellia bacterium]